jgi:hypothetical protein
MKVTKEEARDIIFDCHDEWSSISTEVYGSTRWSTLKRGYFRHLESQKVYMLGWQDGATECQGERPFDYTEPVLVEVVQIPKTIMVWVKV